MTARIPLEDARILVTGASGLLGFALLKALRETGGKVAGVWATTPLTEPTSEAVRCDLRDRSSVRELFAHVRPDYVVHGAALTDVGVCERQPDLARAVNVEATRWVALQSAESNASLTYISTEAVYGEGSTVHVESDICRPLSIYGRTKLEGEEEALRHVPSALVLRTTIVGTAPFDSKSFVAWLLQAFRRNEPIRGFQDVSFSPLFTRDFSRLLLEAIRRKVTGVWNVGASSACSKFDFARMLATALGFEPELVQPGSLAEAKLSGPRCFQLALDSTRFATQTGTILPRVEEGIESFAADLRTKMTPQTQVSQS